MIDMVPKAITLTLVNHSKENLQRELLQELYKPEVLDDLLKESEFVVNRRKEVVSMIQALNKAEEYVAFFSRPLCTWCYRMLTTAFCHQDRGERVRRVKHSSVRDANGVDFVCFPMLHMRYFTIPSPVYIFLAYSRCCFLTVDNNRSGELPFISEGEAQPRVAIGDYLASPGSISIDQLLQGTRRDMFRSKRAFALHA